MLAMSSPRMNPARGSRWLLRCYRICWCWTFLQGYWRAERGLARGVRQAPLSLGRDWA
jgi:hypothetical protein